MYTIASQFSLNFITNIDFEPQYIVLLWPSRTQTSIRNPTKIDLDIVWQHHQYIFEPKISALGSIH